MQNMTKHFLQIANIKLFKRYATWKMKIWSLVLENFSKIFCFAFAIDPKQLKNLTPISRRIDFSSNANQLMHL